MFTKRISSQGPLTCFLNCQNPFQPTLLLRRWTVAPRNLYKKWRCWRGNNPHWTHLEHHIVVDAEVSDMLKPLHIKPKLLCYIPLIQWLFFKWSGWLSLYCLISKCSTQSVSFELYCCFYRGLVILAITGTLHNTFLWVNYLVTEGIYQLELPLNTSILVIKGRDQGVLSVYPVNPVPLILRKC